MSKSLLLINLGTPDKPTYFSVFKYLRQFLMDGRVININPILRYILVNFIICPTRSFSSTKIYKEVWDSKTGSPLLHNTKELTKKIKNIIIENKIFLKLLTIDNELSQIGDNDSGRLLYFLYDEKEPLNMNWLFDLIDLSIKSESKKSINKHSFENSDSIEIESLLKVEHQAISIFQKEFDYYAYPDFGIYIWKNSTDYLSIRCGNLGQNGIGGHAHYDQLSIECYSNGKWFARDPGTGTYTDNIKVRNTYRSVESHWGPNLMFKNNQSFKECFELNNIEPGKVLIFSQNQFLGKAKFNDVTIYRKIKIMDGQLNITDFSEDSSLSEYKRWSSRKDGSKYSFSKGYKRFN